MSTRFAAPASIAVLAFAAGSLVTYVATRPADPAAAKAEQAALLQKDNSRAIEKAVKHPLLARQLSKSNVALVPEVLDSGETAIALTGSKHAYLVQEPNQHRASKNVHYTTWKYMVFKDEMRGTTSRVATIGNLIEYTGNMNEPFMLTLNIRCEDKNNACEMFFASQFTFDPTISGAINGTEFTIGLDGKDIATFPLRMTSDYQYALASDKLYRYLYDNLEAAKKLRVELSSGSNAQFEFDLSGFDWKKFNGLTLEQSTARLKI